MKVIVWVCEGCNTRCIARFNGARSGYYNRLTRPFESCIWDEGVSWIDKSPWKLRKMEESEIVKYFVDGNKRWDASRR